MGKKSKAQTGGKSSKIKEIEAQAELKRIDRNGKLWSIGLRMFGAVVSTGLVMLGTYKSVEVLAGQTTVANVVVSFGIKLVITISAAVALIFGAGGTAYGYQQRKLRHDTIESWSKHKSLLETQVDPDRLSSGLTPQGRTNPEDKI